MHMQALFHKQLLKNLETTELSTGQPKVLAFLKSHEGLTQKDIAQACLLEPGSVTVLLTRMEKMGMVERRQISGDQKRRYVFLSDYGKHLAEESVDSFYQTEEMAFNGFTEEEKSQLMRFCSRIIDNLHRQNLAE